MAEDLKEQRKAEREALTRVLEAIGSRHFASDAYQIIAAEVRKLLRAKTVAVGLAAPAARTMDFVAVAGRDPGEIVGLRVATEDTLADPALRSGKAVVLNPGALSGIHSGAISPILSGNLAVGAIIAVDREDETPFDEEALDLLTVFGRAAGLLSQCERALRTLTEKERELAALYDASRSITSTVNMQSVLDSALMAISRHVPAQTAVVFLMNDERTLLFVSAHRGLVDDEREVQLPAETGLAAEVLKSGVGRIFGDLQGVEDADAISPTERARSLMVSPIRSATETYGLLIVTSAQPNAYRKEDLRLLDAVASLAGIAIQNATLYEDATQRAEAANALFTFSQRVGSTLNIEEIAEHVADAAMNLIGVDRFAVMLMDYRHGRLKPWAVRGLDRQAFSAYQPRAGEGIAGWVYEWTYPVAVADVAADSRNRMAPIHQFGVVSCMCVPVASADAVQGVLLAMSSRRRLFTVAEMELFYTIANQTALAIVNASAYQRAQERALAMRRYFRRFASAVGSVLDSAQVLQLFTDVTLDVMAVDRCAIYAMRGGELTLMAESRLPGRVAPDARVAVGEGLTGQVASTGRTLALVPVSDDPRAKAHAWHGKEQVASYLGLPLRANRRVMGVLELLTSEPRSFTPDEIRVISQFVLKARLGERLEEETQ